ncbi:FtsX-like permease family protein [Marivirga salinae]|uniref:FtsX-like permease family protein n=1 Tax=Marivirga salinarum TaxID=3059078 RepID=A0AA51NCY8_9BACT|nr:FtsX-like permease family protein [Marivirga sp. BDSF4-3]WMN12994.1 FtsX-like permease family protein [Marivirga sp. BDSF4-3]
MKNKLYSIINITGLSVGVACSLLIFLYVSNELSYDEFHENTIYRATRDLRIGDNEVSFPFTPAPLSGVLNNEIPEVNQAVRIRTVGSYLVKRTDSDESFKKEGLMFADSGFFKVFSFPLLEGNPERQFKEPNTIAISNQMAKKYFPNQSAINKSLVLDGEDTYKITGVFEDIPTNSHFQANFLMSMANLSRAENTSFTSNNFYTYFTVDDKVDPKVLQTKINEAVNVYLEPQIMKFMGKSLKELEALGNYYVIEIQSLKDIYLNSDFTVDIGLMGNKDYIYLFSAIAIFIIILACINFMNLSTARSANRSKEVGVRKALGSKKSNLIKQFLVESILVSLISIIAGILLVIIVLPMFNNITGKVLIMPDYNFTFILSVVIAAIFVGILAGIYPAFYLSSFKPVETLKGKASLGTGNSFIRSGLVVFQFFISILLIIGTIAIYQQINFIQNKELGFKKDRVLLVNDAYMLNEQRQAFKEEVRKIPDVSQASYSGFLPVSGYNRSDNTFWREGEQPTEDNLVSTQIWSVDHDYLETYQMELVWGRNFKPNLASDSSALIINEAAFRAFGFTDMNGDNYIQTNAFDQETGEFSSKTFNKYKVLGVVKDFHYESLKNDIGPLAFQLNDNSSVLAVQLKTDNIQSSIQAIEGLWKQFASSLPFNYNFLDTEFDNMYNSEIRLSKIFSVFAGLAIMIGCLGLFALASFMAEQRTKEIGIRKVLGASVSGIVLMLSKQFSKLVLIAFLIAVPLAWWGISSWLESYQYRISIGWELFALSGIAAFIIAWITVAYHSIKVAVSNPVNSLKNE